MPQTLLAPVLNESVRHEGGGPQNISRWTKAAQKLDEGGGPQNISR